MKLPPAIRQLQQSYLVQTILIPALITGMGAVLTALLAASKGDLNNLDVDMLQTSLGVGGFAALAYIAGIYQHGLGSASFHQDGSENKLVEKVAEATQAVSGPDADRLGVVVVESTK